MDLREGEQVLKIFHHHPTPFIFDILKVIIGTLPFFIVVFVFSGVLSHGWSIFLHVLLFAGFALMIVYVSLIYWMDQLIVTNMRIFYIDWKYLTMRDQSEAMLEDIQDIQTKEKGFLSYFKAFDYGTLKLDTSSSTTIIEFINAPNPEEIRRFIYHIRNQ